MELRTINLLITSNEESLIKIIRELKPYEKVEIRKDKEGKVDKYILSREQTVFYT